MSVFRHFTTTYWRLPKFQSPAGGVCLQTRGGPEAFAFRVSVPCRGCLSSDELTNETFIAMSFSPLQGVSVFRQTCSDEGGYWRFQSPAGGVCLQTVVVLERLSKVFQSPAGGVCLQTKWDVATDVPAFQSPAGGVCLQTLQFLTPDFQRTYKRKIQHPLSFCLITAKIREGSEWGVIHNPII